MDTKTLAIAAQVALKEASVIAVASNGDREKMAELLEAFDISFEHISDKLVAEITAREEKHMEAYATSTFSATPVTESASSSASNVYQFPTAPPADEFAPTPAGSLRVAGTQHGPLPDWLPAAVAKAGVTEVWDNRDQAVGTKRPWFKQALTQAEKAANVEPAAFWPPKGR